VKRIKEWFVRYAPPELAGIAGALAVAGWFGKPALGALGETFSFYAVVFARDHRPPARVRHTLRDVVFEFGPAELIDSAAVRPLAMYAGTVLLGGMVVGVTAGKIADLDAALRAECRTARRCGCTPIQPC
jgi:hypothetical protein